MPAKMPETRIKPEVGRIMDIPVGGEAIVEVFAVRVDCRSILLSRSRGQDRSNRRGTTGL